MKHQRSWAVGKRQPVYLRAMRLIDPATGGEVSAFVPASATDAGTIRERGMKIGGVVRADMTKPRNVQFHRLAHAIGGMCCQQIDDFSGMSHHAALKKLQVDSGVECDITRTEIPGLGVLESKQPRSMSFDEMDQGQFFQMVTGLCEHIVRTYWQTMTREQVEEMAMSMVQGQAA